MASRSSSSNKKRTSRTRRSSSSRRRTRRSLPKISLTRDQWLDLVGVVLLLLALLTALSFLSNQGMVTGWWLSLLRTTFGWGVFAVPIGLAAVGLWLILRHFEDKRPQIEPDVAAGIALAYVTGLATLHLIANLFHDEGMTALAEQGVGGGHVGRILDELFLDAVGDWGTVVVLLALWVVALTFSLNLSMSELGQRLGRVWSWASAAAERHGCARCWLQQRCPYAMCRKVSFASSPSWNSSRKVTTRRLPIGRG